MTPGLRYFTAPCALFEFENEVLSFPLCAYVTIHVCVCACVCAGLCLFNHHTAPFLCKQNIYPHARRPETPVAYEVAMATAEMHSGLLPRSWGPRCAAPSGGNAGKTEWSGSEAERTADLGLTVSAEKKCVRR